MITDVCAISAKEAAAMIQNFVGSSEQVCIPIIDSCDDIKNVVFFSSIQLAKLNKMGQKGRRLSFALSNHLINDQPMAYGCHVFKPETIAGIIKKLSLESELQRRIGR